MKSRILKKNQKGQGVMEYIILSTLIGIFCLGVTSQFGGQLKERIENIKSKMSKESLKLR